jgi:hypothetical protein
MNAATITALSTGIPAIIGAITALVVALKAHSKAADAKAAVEAHTTMGMNLHG